MDDRQTQANIHFMLKLAGTSFTAIDSKYGLYRGAANQCLREPIAKAERAIITELRVKLGKDDYRCHPHALWPRRYRDDGSRYPQEHLLALYRNGGDESPRQKAAGGLT